MGVYPEFLNDLEKRVIQHILGFDDEKKNHVKEANSLSWINEQRKNVAAAKKVRENQDGYAVAKKLIEENERHEDEVWHSMGRIDRISFDQFFESSIEKSPFDDIIEYLLKKKSLELDESLELNVDEYIKVYEAIEDIEEEKQVFSNAQETADDNFRRLLDEIHR